MIMKLSKDSDTVKTQKKVIRRCLAITISIVIRLKTKMHAMKTINAKKRAAQSQNP